MLGGMPTDGMVEDEHPLCGSVFLQDFLNFWIIHVSDPFFVFKELLRTRILDELEPGGIKANRVLFVPDIMNNDRVDVRSDICSRNARRWFAHVHVRWFVGQRCEVVEGSVNVARSMNFDGHDSCRYGSWDTRTMFLG